MKADELTKEEIENGQRIYDYLKSVVDGKSEHWDHHTKP
jgi:hypothetical protein